MSQPFWKDEMAQDDEWDDNNYGNHYDNRRIHDNRSFNDNRQTNDNRQANDNRKTRDNRKTHDNKQIQKGSHNTFHNERHHKPVTNNYFGVPPPAAAAVAPPHIQQNPVNHQNQARVQVGQAAGSAQSNMVNVYGEGVVGVVSNVAGIPPLEPKIEAVKPELIKNERVVAVSSVRPIQIPNNSNNNNNNNTNNNKEKEVVNLISPESSSGDSSNTSSTSVSGESMNRNTEITYEIWSKAVKLKTFNKKTEKHEAKRKSNKNTMRRFSATLESCVDITDDNKNNNNNNNNNTNPLKKKEHNRNLSNDSEQSSSSWNNTSESTDDGDESMEMNDNTGKKSKNNKQGKKDKKGKQNKKNKQKKQMDFEEAIVKTSSNTTALIEENIPSAVKDELTQLKRFNAGLIKKDNGRWPNYPFMVYIDNPNSDTKDLLNAIMSSSNLGKCIHNISPKFCVISNYKPSYENYLSIMEICENIRRCKGIKIVFLINCPFTSDSQALTWCDGNEDVFRSNKMHSLRLLNWPQRFNKCGLRFLMNLYSTDGDKNDLIKFTDGYTPQGLPFIDIQLISTTTIFKYFVILNKFRTNMKNMESVNAGTRDFGLPAQW